MSLASAYRYEREESMNNPSLNSAKARLDAIITREEELAAAVKNSDQARVKTLEANWAAEADKRMFRARQKDRLTSLDRETKVAAKVGLDLRRARLREQLAADTSAQELEFRNLGLAFSR
eukprot:UC4_evm2s205